MPLVATSQRGPAPRSSPPFINEHGIVRDRTTHPADDAMPIPPIEGGPPVPIATAAQRDALIRIVCLLRPDFDPGGVFAVLKKAHTERNPLLDRPFEDIVVACTRKAADPRTRTPVVLLLDGAHWQSPGITPVAGNGPVRNPCQDHDTEEAHNCRSCWADVRVGDRPETHIGVHYEVTPTFDTAFGSTP